MMAASGIDDDLSSKIGASKAQFLLKSVGQAVHSVGSAFFTSMTEVISYRTSYPSVRTVYDFRIDLGLCVIRIQEKRDMSGAALEGITVCQS